MSKLTPELGKKDYLREQVKITMAKKNSSGGVVIIGLVIAALFIKFWQPLVTIGIVVLIIWAVVRLGKKRETASQPQSKQISSSHLSPSHAIRTGQVFEPQNQSTSFKPRTTIQFPDDIWVPSGKTIQHAGYLIPGGLIYFGRGLHSVSNRQEEPALINPKLPVDNTRPDREGRNISYWPSYSEIPPSSRAAYLEWLSNGKKDPNINIGYVFLYFYGLERRALADTKKSASARNEITTIIAEAKRLLSIYGGNGSFRGYVGTFSDALEASSLQATHLYLTTPKIQPLSWETPLTLKVALGQIARDGVQLPAEWALAWAGNDPSMPQRTPTQRCPEEFRELFRLRYSEKFGEGFKLKINKTPIQTTYRPASSSFGGAIEISSPLPDLTKITGPSAKIRDLATACIDELEGYSRYLGRNPDGKNSIEAISYLPKPLLKGHGGADFKKMSEWLDKILSTETLAPVHFSSVLQQCPSINQTTFGKKEATAIANLLGKMNIGIEPDPRFGSIVPKPEQDVILFRISDNAPSSPSAEYSAATVVLHLASAVAGADGTIHQTEERHLEEHLEEWLHLAADERTRLKAHTQWLLSSFPSLSGVKKRMELLRQDQKESLGRFLVGVAQADGYIDPSEIKTLTKIYEMLGLDTQSLYSHAHAAAATPVTVQTADFVKSQGYAIPVPPTKPAKGISLDFGSIETKLAETVAVSAILNSIFTGDEQAQPTAPAPDPTVSDVPIAGMDLESFSFMQVLASKLIWVRGELEKLAADHNLMLDGTLDSINDASFDHFGGPFFEGDDPIEINPEFAKEIAA